MTQDASQEDKVKGSRWLQHEDDYLIANYGSLDLGTLAQELGRSRCAVKYRANFVLCLRYTHEKTLALRRAALAKAVEASSASRIARKAEQSYGYGMTDLERAWRGIA